MTGLEILTATTQGCGIAYFIFADGELSAARAIEVEAYLDREPRLRDEVRRLQELQHLVRSMERSGELHRAIEFLPDDEGFAERRKQGLGLTRPELAILVSYSKIVLNTQLLESDVPEDPYLSAELERLQRQLERLKDDTSDEERTA